MNLDVFLAQRRPAWQRLETLLERAQRDLRRLSPGELDDLGRLYRLTAADLALAQRDYPNQAVAAYLNQLVGRAHALIYRSGPLRRRGLVDFYLTGFPQLYRALLPYTTAAFVLFMAAALAAFAAVLAWPSALVVLEGPGMERLVDEVRESRTWAEIVPALRSAASAFILTNNIQVTFLTFAGGVTGGLFTVYIMLLNGLHLGAVFGLMQAHGLVHYLAEFVAAHGFIELSVIFLGGGCGLYMGDALLRPGLRRRLSLLAERAATGVLCILACAPLLVLAGLIEGFISPSGLPWWVKLAVGAATGIALHVYWLRAGRHAAEPATGAPSPYHPQEVQ